MLVGSDIAAVVAILEPFPIDILRLNCATAAEQMKGACGAILSAHSPFVVSCIPPMRLAEMWAALPDYRLRPWG